MDKKWETYEQVARYLLDQFSDEFGLDHVEGKQTIPGKQSGTRWEIDAKGVRTKDEGFIIVECRRRTTKENQESIAALAYRIHDTGAEGGIIVTPLGIQEGATKVADAENIQSVRLDPNSTRSDYILKFLERTMHGASFGLTTTVGIGVSMEQSRLCLSCDKTFTVRHGEQYCDTCSIAVR